MVKAYWKVLPAFHVSNSYGKMVPLRHPMVKPYPPSSLTTIPRPLAYLAIVATLRGVLLTVGYHHRLRTLPGMTRFGGAHPPKNPQPPNAASLLPQNSLKNKFHALQ